MKQEELLFLKALKESLHPDSSDKKDSFESSIWQPYIEQLLTLSRQHKMLPPIYEFLCRHQLQIPREQMSSLTTELATYVLSSHQMEYFTKYTCQLLDAGHIPYALLKGQILSDLYPKPVYRRYGDLDILVNNKTVFKKAVALLLQNNYVQVPSSSDHHYEFKLIKNNRTYILELHNHVTHSHDNIDLYDKINNLYDNISLCAPLSPTLEALYLLLHMLKHLLNFGFGIKLLCDWVVYLEAHTDDIDNSEFGRLLETLSLTVFAKSITAFCVCHLGLIRFPDCLNFGNELDQEEIFSVLSEDIFTGGEYGYEDSTRTIIMKSSSHLSDYCKELHRQTRRNYPTSSRFIISLPLLWLITGIRFLYNNRHIRHTTTKEIIATTKKRQILLKTLNIKL